MIPKIKPTVPKIRSLELSFIFSGNIIAGLNKIKIPITGVYNLCSRSASFIAAGTTSTGIRKIRNQDSPNITSLWRKHLEAIRIVPRSNKDRIPQIMDVSLGIGKTERLTGMKILPR